MITALELSKKLETFENLISLTQDGKVTFRDAWNREREIRENFKAASFDNEDIKTVAKEKFNTLVNLLKEKENNFSQFKETFTANAQEKVNTLEQTLTTLQQKELLVTTDFTEAKEQIQILFDIFKQNHWTNREVRNATWEKFETLKNAIKLLEDEVYKILKQKKATFTEASNSITIFVKEVVINCHPNKPIKDLALKLQELDTHTQSIENLEKIDWFVLQFPEQEHYTLKCQNETLQNIRKFLLVNKEFFTKENKHEVYNDIDSLKADIQEAWATYKENQEKKQEEWKIIQQERLAKKEVWLEKQTAFLKMLENRILHQQQYLEKQKDFLRNQEEFAKKFEVRKNQQTEYISKLNDQITDLEHKKETAWNDDFRSKIELWIEEKIAKCNAVDEDIMVLNNKIIDINANVAKIKMKIEELEISIIELNNKKQEVTENISN